ncbi:MAG: copper homeostasis protein CutC [Gammaproteobacteria bacterium]|nr:copper homeostasis protein CutC [Gammaproteobacteria bacterium]
MTAHKPCLEICVDSVAGPDVAARAGVDRIELCSALNLAGLTPSAGLMAIAATKATPCFVLIRPRAGDFRYDVRDVDLMRREIDIVRSMRLAGIVIGASRVDGSLDEEILRALLEHAAGLPAVLHRAFDLAPDFHAALETAIELGFVRVLTSGGAPDAVSGSAVIRSLVEQAAGRIEIMAGAGLTPDNVMTLVRSTRVPALHSSCSTPVGYTATETTKRGVTLGFIPAHLNATDPMRIAAMIASLDSLRA